MTEPKARYEAFANRRLDRLMAEVEVHLDRCNNAPNEATRLAEHAQALGLLRAIDIVKETP